VILKTGWDDFDTLYADSQKTARVMGILLHPFLMGEPWRTPYLKKAIAYSSNTIASGSPPAARSSTRLKRFGRDGIAL